MGWELGGVGDGVGDWGRNGARVVGGGSGKVGGWGGRQEEGDVQRGRVGNGVGGWQASSRAGRAAGPEWPQRVGRPDGRHPSGPSGPAGLTDGAQVAPAGRPA